MDEPYPIVDDEDDHDDNGEMATILQSFDAVYRGIIPRLPQVLQPTSVQHGKHSYTTSVIDGWGKSHRVEVLLRQQAFKPKTEGVKAASHFGLQKFWHVV